jgi:L-ascorbate metabolism protein UlaG (beta-lactamase superfamily)
MYLTYLDANSWLMEIGEQRILLDPWLVGDLVFANAPWLFINKRNQKHQIPENIDLILLSQGLEDHAHTPTLKQLDHNIPVVASPNATKVVKELGYTKITTLVYGESFTLYDQVEIKAVPGSPIGPTLVENGYVIKDLQKKHSIYYEPHGYHSPTLKEEAPVDVVITPLTSIKIPLLGSVIKGGKSALEISQLLKPQVMLPTAAGGDVEYGGLLNSLLKMEGTLAQFKSMLEENDLKTKVIEPKSGEQFELQL